MVWHQGEWWREREKRTTNTFDGSNDVGSHLEWHAKEPIIPVICLKDP